MRRRAAAVPGGAVDGAIQLCGGEGLSTLARLELHHLMHDEIDPRTWQRIYLATVAYGLLTIAFLWWFTAVYA